MIITPFYFTVYFVLNCVGCLMGAGYATKEENGGKILGYLIIAGMDIWAVFSMLEIAWVCK